MSARTGVTAAPCTVSSVTVESSLEDWLPPRGGGRVGRPVGRREGEHAAEQHPVGHAHRGMRIRAEPPSVEVVGAQFEIETTDPFCGYTNPPVLVVETVPLPGIEKAQLIPTHSVENMLYVTYRPPATSSWNM